MAVYSLAKPRITISAKIIGFECPIIFVEIVILGFGGCMGIAYAAQLMYTLATHDLPEGVCDQRPLIAEAFDCLFILAVEKRTSFF